MIHYIIFLLLTSPAFSVIPFLGFPYFPNEKLALVLVFYLLIINRVYLDFRKIIFLLFCSVLFLIIVIFHGVNKINVAEINTVYFFCALILYITYFEKYSTKLLFIFPKIVIFQVCISLFQQFSMLSGYTDLAMIFNNYPYQNNYFYPTSYLGFYRTSALFNESSQYSTFLFIYIFLYWEGVIKKSRIANLTFYLCLTDIIINESITAYGICIIYVLYIMLFPLKKHLFLKVGIFTLTGILSFLYPHLILGVESKIFHTFSMDINYPRLSAAVEKFQLATESHPWIGYGLTWDKVSWDVFSIYYYSFGFFGVTVIFVFLVLFTLTTMNFLTLAFLLFLLTNGNLQGCVNIILIAFSFLFKQVSYSNGVSIQGSSRVYLLRRLNL